MRITIFTLLSTFLFGCGTVQPVSEAITPAYESSVVYRNLKQPNSQVLTKDEATKLVEWDRLKMKTRMNFYSDIKTTGQAIEYILEPTHYRFVSTRDTARYMNTPIPATAQHAGVKPIIQALLILCNNNCSVAVDHENKLITYMPEI